MVEDVQNHNSLTKQATSTLVRLHEKWMEGTEKRIERLELNIGKIPWILLGAVLSALLSAINLLVLLLPRLH